MQQAFDGTISNGELYIPIEAREAQSLTYDDRVRVTLKPSDGEAITFTRPLNASGSVGVPSDIREIVGVAYDESTEITAVAEDTGTRWRSENPMESRSHYRKETRTIGEKRRL